MDFENVPGHGIKATIEGWEPRRGSELACIVVDADTVKGDAKEVVAALRERGIDVMLFTGDNEWTARDVAEQVGIGPANVRAEVLPEDKSDVVDRSTKSDDGPVELSR